FLLRRLGVLRLLLLVLLLTLGPVLLLGLDLLLHFVLGLVLRRRPLGPPSLRGRPGLLLSLLRDLLRVVAPAALGLLGSRPLALGLGTICLLLLRRARLAVADVFPVGLHALFLRTLYRSLEELTRAAVRLVLLGGPIGPLGLGSGLIRFATGRRGILLH